MLTQGGIGSLGGGWWVDSDGCDSSSAEVACSLGGFSTQWMTKEAAEIVMKSMAIMIITRSGFHFGGSVTGPGGWGI